MSAQLRLHAFEPASRANGPGLRAVLWLQGCTLACPGCFNPGTHSLVGEQIGVDVLLARILALLGQIEGITVSGGEPLQQAPALAALLRGVRANSDLSVILFSGYSREEVAANHAREAVLAHVDVLLAGRYRPGRAAGPGLPGAPHKTAHFLSARYSKADLAAVPEAEIIIAADGSIVLSGIAPFVPTGSPC